MAKKAEPFVHHKEKYLDIYDLDGPLEEVIAKLNTLTEGMLNPRISIDRDYDDYNVKLKWDEPMTPKEIEVEKARRKSVTEMLAARKVRQQLIAKAKARDTVAEALDILKEDPELAADFLKKFL
jgi:hypothetical protein